LGIEYYWLILKNKFNMINPATYGKQYEQQIRTKLKTIYTYIPTTAQFGVGPDLTIPANQPNNMGQSILVEIKTSTGSDFGQKAITFDGSSWIPKFSSEELPEHASLYNYLFSTFGISNKIQSSWGLPNNNLNAQDLQILVETKQINQVLFYEKKYQQATRGKNPFPEIQLTRGSKIVDSIVSYYNSKGVFYIQIKGDGFYILGNDVKNLNGLLGINIPKFEPSTARLILRGKPSISNRTYRPVITFKSSTISKSTFNLENLSFIQSLHNNF
tara:strand:- start:3877 stop:4692 length:816 start_codon:yes stop_codon:yes gene_type:complete